MERRWKLVPHLLLRRAGFPFALLDPLAAPQTAALASRLVSSHRNAQAARQQLLKTLFPAEVTACAQRGDRVALRKLSDWRKRVGRQLPSAEPDGTWSPALIEGHRSYLTFRGAALEAQAAFAAALEKEQQEARRAARSCARRPDVQEALFLLSPDFFESAQRTLARAAEDNDPSLDRKLYAFLQRLASKNETTSFFGPLTHAQVANVDAVRFGPETERGVQRRETFAAFWAAAAFGRTIASDPAVRAHLPVRRIPAARVEGATAIGADGAQLPLEADVLRLWEWIDGTRTVRELASRAELEEGRATALVRQLEKAAVVRRDLEPLSTTHHPLEDLLAQLPNHPVADKWREVLARFGELLRTFGTADLEGRRAGLRAAETFFEQTTGKPARRGAGQMYADRTVLYEDCEGDQLPVLLPSAEAERIQTSLAPVLELGAAYGALRYRAARALAARVMEGLPSRVPYLQFASELEARVAKGELKPLLGPAEAFLERLGERVRARAKDGVARLLPGDVAELAKGEGRRGRFASPDLMFWQDRPGGPPRLVIGEVHPYVYAWGSQGLFAPDPDGLQRAFREDLSPWGGPSRIATVLRRRRHKGLVSEAFPGKFIEVTGRGTADPARRLSISELTVERGEDGPVLMSTSGPLCLYVGEDDHPHLRCFAPPLVEIPPVRLGAHTPRIEVGEVVLQRARWQLPSELPDVAHATTSAGLFLAVAQLSESLGCPRYVFASSRSEPKPICLDLEAPFAQKVLQRLLRLGGVDLVEMVPDPAGLWLSRADGRHTSEWRLAMICQSEDPIQP